MHVYRIEFEYGIYAMQVACCEDIERMKNELSKDHPDHIKDMVRCRIDEFMRESERSEAHQ